MAKHFSATGQSLSRPVTQLSEHEAALDKEGPQNLLQFSTEWQTSPVSHSLSLPDVQGFEHTAAVERVAPQNM